MKARLKKQQHNNDVAPLMPSAVQGKLLQDARSHDSPFSKPETAQSISQEDRGSDRGFNFAEIPIFAAGSGASASPLQRKLNVSLAREKQEGQAARLEAVTATQAGQQQPVQRNAEEQEEPMQGKLEPIQREEGEEEELMQGKLEPIQREEGEEEELMQGKLEPIQREEGEEEELMQGKLEPIQREEGEEEELMQGKLEPIQREEGEEEEPMQGKGESDQKVKAIQPKINIGPSGSGNRMPEPVQQKMEAAFGTDFSGVRIHEGSQAKAINAIAYTQGSDIHFQPGKYQPDTRSGQELLGHELTHVVQQRAGRVAAPQKKGIPINNDSNLETEADVLGAKAARGEQAQVAGVNSSPVQDWFPKNDIVIRPSKEISNRGVSNTIVPAQLTPISKNAILQRKSSHLPELDDKMISVSIMNSIFGSGTATKTQQIQQEIQKYNKIKMSDDDYDGQMEQLEKIYSICEEWIQKDKDNKDLLQHRRKQTEVSDQLLSKKSKKVQAIWMILEATSDEHERVKKDYIDFRDKHPGAGFAQAMERADRRKEKAQELEYNANKENPLLETATEAKDAYSNTKEMLEAGQDLGSAIKQVLTGSTKEAEQVTTAAVNAGFLDSLKALGSKVSALATKYAFSEFLGVATAAYGFYTSYNDVKNLQSASQEADNKELQEATKYGYEKVFRRCWTSALPKLLRNIMELISKIAAWFTGGTGLILDLISKAWGSVETIALKSKGFFKAIMGRRGVNREKNANVIVTHARVGSETALDLLLKLDLFGFADKATLEVKSKLNLINKQDISNELPSNEPSQENRNKMSAFLMKVSESPHNYGLDMKDFTSKVADKLKSFV